LQLWWLTSLDTVRRSGGQRNDRSSPVLVQSSRQWLVL